MKKKLGAVMTIAAVCCLSVFFCTGCEMSDFTALFVGDETASSGDPDEETGSKSVELPEYVTGQAVEIEEYDATTLVELSEYKGVEVDCTVTDDEVQAEIDTLLDEHKKQVKSGTAENGMSVNIDYSGKLDGKKFDGGTAEDVTIKLGKSGMIPGFDDGIIGMKVGEKKDVELTFPEDYHAEELAGKKAVFTMKLNYIEEEPTFDDAFVKKNTDYKTVAEYKDAKKKELFEDKKTTVPSQALQTVLGESKVSSVPPTLLLAEKEMMRSQTLNQVAQYGMTLEDMLEQSGQTEEDFEKYLEMQAQQMAESELILEAIGIKENVDTSKEAVDAYTNEMIEKNDTSLEEVKESYKNFYGDAMPFERYIKESLLYTKVTEIVGDAAKIIQN
ncbi:MAG: trigger factor [Eubacterium sp.]|nr:trigger factor [Eubacterium sp.]